MMNKKQLIFFLVFLLTSIAIFIFQKNTKADLAYFYPQSCLGSFINSEKAQGEPETDNLNLISEANSAVYLGGFKEIYCGNFQGPTTEGEIQNINLKFNLLLTNERKETPITEQTSTEKNLLEKIFPSKTIEIINTSTENPPENISTTTIETPQSFFYKIIFAQEITTNSENLSTGEQDLSASGHENTSSISTENLPTTSENNQSSQDTQILTSQESTSQSISTELTQTTLTEPISTQITPATQTTTTETTTIETTTTSTEQTINYFDIFYTLDGKYWEYLGSITNQNWQNVQFSIPVNDWVLVSKIQIKIQSNPILEKIPYLYLEGMMFEIEVFKETFQENLPIQSQIELKERKINREVKIKNPEKISCQIEPFSISLNEDETKGAILILNSIGVKNLEIGNLPQGIEITFAENSDYQIQTNSNQISLNITRKSGSIKGNFNLPIIFDADEATIICQINIIAY